MRLATAATSLTLAVVLVACGSGVEVTEDPSPSQQFSVTAAPAPTGNASPMPSATGTASGAPDVRETTFPTEGLGRGIVVGLSPDSSHAYVIAEHPRLDETGCEGAEAPHLWRVDLETGARSSAVPEARYPLAAAPISNGRGQALLVEQCEGFLVGVTVATQSLDGTLTQLRPVEIDSDVDAQAFTFAWDRSGTGILFTTSAAFSKDGVTSQVWHLDAGGDARPIVDLPHAGRVAALSDGRYVVETAGDTVVLSAAARIQTRYEGYATVAVAPDDTLALASGDAGLAVALPGEPAAIISAADVWELRWSPDSALITYLTDGSKGGDFDLTLEVVDRDGGRRERLEDVGFSGGFFDTAVSQLVYTATGDDPSAVPSGVPSIQQL